jgi:hypothetical protein
VWIKLKHKPTIIAFAIAAAFLLASTNCYAQPYEHSLHFYQIRYGDNMGAPLPAGKVEFTIGPNAYESLLQYAYVSFMTINSYDKISRGNADNYVVSLTDNEPDSEIGAVYNQKGYWQNGVFWIDLNELQIADIQKLQSESGEPPLYFGAELDASEKPIMQAGLTEVNYQNGETIVVPARYNNDVNFRRRFFFNLNTAAVREYMALYALKQAGSKNIFVDGAFVSNCQICVNCGFYEAGQCPGGKSGELYYISSGSASSQIIKYTSQINGILSKIKENDRSRQIILNGFGLRQSHQSTAEVLDRLLTNGSANFDGIMMENQFWGNDDFYTSGGIINNCIDPEGYQGLTYRGTICTDIEYYRDWILELKNNNKKFLFAAGTDGTTHPDYSKFALDSALVEDIGLWFHLIASENTYFYINQLYQKPMLNYQIYNSPLGAPLEEGPSKEDPTCQVNCTWRREYQRGTIVFDTTKGCLSEIKFIEKEPPAEICDGTDNDGDGQIDEDNVCCGNNVCDTDIGETFATCSADCPQECVDMPKLTGYISQWKRGEISMLTLMQKMKQWKAGTGCLHE